MDHHGDRKCCNMTALRRSQIKQSDFVKNGNKVKYTVPLIPKNH